MQKNENLVPYDEKKGQINMFFGKPNILKSLKAALPKGDLTTDRLIRALSSAICQNPKLLECSPMSLFTALIQSAIVGLIPNTPLGHSFLIPYWNKDKNVSECQFQMGYKGYIELANRSGHLGSWVSHPVYEHDEFIYENGTNEYIKHIPNNDNPGKMICVYSIFRYPSGMHSQEVMTKKQVDEIRQRSKAPNSPAWSKDYSAMARAKVMKRHSNHLPLSEHVATAAVLDGKNDSEEDLDLTGIIDIESNEKIIEKTSLQMLAEKSGDLNVTIPKKK